MDDWEKTHLRMNPSIADRQAQDHHTRCRDCGVFVSKARWVRKDSHDAIQHQKRPLCGPCWEEHDDY